MINRFGRGRRSRLTEERAQRAKEEQEEVFYSRLLSIAKKSKTRKIPVTEFSRPLIDVVNPQPKAFFAYLNMPTTKKTNSAGRIRRRRTEVQ